jgi:hypothetical protein
MEALHRHDQYRVAYSLSKARDQSGVVIPGRKLQEGYLGIYR